MQGLPWTFAMDVRKPPFDDIRVRTAMQLALDTRDNQRHSCLGGWATRHHTGLLGRLPSGSTPPFEEWPQQIKDNYAYDPERAKAASGRSRLSQWLQDQIRVLLGKHGMAATLDYSQLAVAYWAEIGVDVEIDILEMTAMRANA